MGEVAACIAPVATTIAAMMTAANLGARVTGWGFVIFLIGAFAWVTVGIDTGQAGLLWSNAFLALIDVIGIWRWLGRRARLDDGAKRASAESADRPVPALFPVDTLSNGKLSDESGETLGQAVGAMVQCATGQLAYVVARDLRGGRLEIRHVAIPWAWIDMQDGAMRLRSGRRLAELPEIDAQAWPSQVPASQR